MTEGEIVGGSILAGMNELTTYKFDGDIVSCLHVGTYNDTQILITVQDRKELMQFEFDCKVWGFGLVLTLINLTKSSTSTLFYEFEFATDS